MHTSDLFHSDLDVLSAQRRLGQAMAIDLEEYCLANEGVKAPTPLTSSLNVSTIDNKPGVVHEDLLHFTSTIEQPFSIDFYISRLMEYCESSSSAYIIALVYIHRLQVSHREFSITSLTFHRLYSTALLLAIKYIDDVVYPNSHYADVIGISTEDLNVLEIKLLKLLDWNLNVTEETFKKYENALADTLENVGETDEEN